MWYTTVYVDLYKNVQKYPRKIRSPRLWVIGGACAVSGYQALSPPHINKGPGYEASSMLVLMCVPSAGEL